MMKSIKKHILGFSNSEKGFTLIEIIAVLVILGILAAVAIPRFTNMQDQARISAAEGAIAEAKARCSLGYANGLLSTNGDAANMDGANVLANINSTDFGDFGVDLTAATNDVTISVNAVQTVAISPAVADTWVSPNAP